MMPARKPDMRALLVDDEEIARRGLRIRLERAGGVQIVGECSNGPEALEAVRRLAPDVVFLDIQMPEFSGMEVARSLPDQSRPHLVFVTAFDQYAVRAFEVHALDYLLKPINDERLAATLRHVREVISDVRDGAHAAAAPNPVPSDRIAIPVDDRLAVVRVAEIDWLGALGNYVSLHVGKKSWHLRETVSAMERRLAPHGFVRIHRSTIVNVQRVTELRSLTNGEFSVALADGTTLKLSRGYRESLDLLIGRL